MPEYMRCAEHQPRLFREYDPDGSVRERVRCRACLVGTEWQVAAPSERSTAWDRWAALMAQMSAAVHEAKDAEAGRVADHQAAESKAAAAGDEETRMAAHVVAGKEAICTGLVEALVAEGLIGDATSYRAIVGEARAALIFRKNAKRLLTQKEFGAIATGHHPFGKVSQRADAEIERIVVEAVERTSKRLSEKADAAVRKVAAAAESAFVTVDNATKHRPCRHGVYGGHCGLCEGM